MVTRRTQHAQVRTALGWLPLAALTACALIACEDSSSTAKPNTAQTAAAKQPKAAADGSDKLDKRCEKLGQACGQKDKHREKITKECKQAAWAQTDKGCVDQAVATYDCYEKELCGKDHKIWALDDFRVLSERHEKCVAERKAAQKCVTGSDEK